VRFGGNGRRRSGRELCQRVGQGAVDLRQLAVEPHRFGIGSQALLEFGEFRVRQLAVERLENLHGEKFALRG
jgi:hypothetical protein